MATATAAKNQTTRSRPTARSGTKTKTGQTTGIEPISAQEWDCYQQSSVRLEVAHEAAAQAVLGEISEAGTMSISSLQGRLGMPRPYLAAVCRRLAKAGFIEGKPVGFTLTKLGARLWEGFQAVVDDA